MGAGTTALEADAFWIEWRILIIKAVMKTQTGRREKKNHTRKTLALQQDAVRTRLSTPLKT